LNSIKGEEVIIGLNKENNPGLFKGDKDNSFVYVLMPIKI
jgi:DNA polymerase III sliding clamp (beta) subunit (PCNA family)